MNTNITIRMAQESDAEELLEIYTPYVTDTAISFEYEVPSVAEFASRMKNTLKRYPYLVALEDNRIVGYAYASEFKKRAAYDWAVETTIYLRQDCRGKGVGKRLYLALEDMLRRQNVLNLNACIAYTSTEDIHLTNASMEFHQHLGYEKVAHFTKCGNKFNIWYDMIWMEKLIGEHPDVAVPFIPIKEL